MPGIRPAKPIRVLVVDDSRVIRDVLSSILEKAEGIEVVGTAADPLEARERIKALNPDVLTLDVEMPKMDGITFLRNLMRLRPMPVVMISTLTEKGADVTFEALSIGAVDYIPKPKTSSGAGLLDYSNEIVEKIRIAAKAHIRALDRRDDRRNINRSIDPDYRPSKNHVIAIGASTGGTEAIKEVLLGFPSNMPPIVVTQHIPAAFSASYAERMNRTTNLIVHEACNGQVLEEGHVYIAPGDDHLRIRRQGSRLTCVLDKGEPINRHRPAVDPLFDSVAEAMGKNATGILLTGMGADGAKGLLHLKEAGAFTICQDESTSVVWGMPGAAVAMDAQCAIEPLNRIPALAMKKSAARKLQ